MDNLAIWIVILILAYAVLRLWRSTVERAREHVEHIKELEWKVEHLRETVFEEEIKEEKKLREEWVKEKADRKSND